MAQKISIEDEEISTLHSKFEQDLLLDTVAKIKKDTEFQKLK